MCVLHFKRATQYAVGTFGISKPRYTIQSTQVVLER